MQRVVLNKSWRQHQIKQQLLGHQPPLTKTISVRRTRHPGHCWRGRDELISDFCEPLHMDEQRQDDQLEPIYNSSVSIQDIVRLTPRERWMIKTGGERGSERSVLTAWMVIIYIILLVIIKIVCRYVTLHTAKDINIQTAFSTHTHTCIYIYIYINPRSNIA